MRNRLLATWCAGMALWAGLGHEAWADPQPWLVLPWGDQGAPTLRPGGEDELPLGPTAIAVTADGLFVADPADGEVLRVGWDGTVEGILAPVAAVDLAVDADGSVALLGEEMDRVVWRTPDGAWQEAPRTSPGESFRRLAWDGDGGLWGEHPDGAATLLSRPAPDDRERALPLTGPRAHALARRTEDGRGVVWVWPWEARTGFQSPRARRVVVETELPLGSLRPLAHDDRGRLDVLLEVLASEAPLAVVLEVRRLDADGRVAASLRWPDPTVCPVYRPAAVDAEGTLWVMVPTPAGLAVYRVTADAWQGRMEVRP